MLKTTPNPQSSEVEAIVKELFLEKSVVVSDIDGFVFNAIRHKELQEIVTNLTQQNEARMGDIISFIHEKKYVSNDLAGDWAISVYDLLEKIAPNTIPSQQLPPNPDTK